ncbi:MAG: DUF1801 domain-containing protein [Pseudomonadota bacterium]
MMPALPDAIAEVVASYPARARQSFDAIRVMIHQEAERLDVGRLNETLKWGEPAFLTDVTRAGTTIRLAWKRKLPDVMGVYVHCQTALVDAWRGRFPDLRFDGNRALLQPLEDDLPVDALKPCISDALTYHRGKRA